MAARIVSFLQIRPGEGQKVVFVAALFALIQAGQGIGGNAADGLFFIRFGVDFLPYMFMVLGAVTFVLTLFYSAGLIRFNQRLYLSAILAVFAALLVAERLAILSGWALLYPLLWLSINLINAITGTLIWFVAGEVCDTRQAKRLFSIFASAGILGGVLGNLVTGLLARALGTENLLLLFAALILASLLLTRKILTRFFHPPIKRKLSASLLGDLTAGYEYVRRSRLLQLTAYASVLFSILYFSLSFPFSQAVSKAFPNEAELAGFLGIFSSLVTAVTFFVSLLLANRLFARLGIVNAILLLPLVYLAGFVLWSLDFVLATAVLARLAQMVILGGIASTAWTALFNVVPAERRGQVLGFDAGVPSQIGVVLSGVLLILGERVLDNTQIFVLGMVVALACGYLIWRMRQAYGEALIEALRAGRYEVFSPSPRAFAGFQGNAQALRIGLNALHDPKPSARRLAIQILAKMGDQAAVPALLEKLNDPEPEVRGAVICALAELGVHDAVNSIVGLLTDSHPGIRADALEVVTKLQTTANPAFMVMLEQTLNDPEPNVSAQAAVALSKFGEAPRAVSKLNSLLCQDKPETRVLALGALGTIAAAGRGGLDLQPVLSAARDPSVLVRRAACQALGQIHDEIGLDVLVERLDDFDSSVRGAASASLRKLGRQATPRVLPLLQIGQDRAQEAALNALSPDDPDLFEPLRHYAEQEVANARRWHVLAQVIPSAGRVTKLLHELLETYAAQSELRLVKAVGLLGHAEAMEWVVKGLKSRSGETRAEAVEALETLGDKRLAQQIIPLLEEIPALSRLEPADALAQLLTQKDGWTRALAARAVGELQLHALIPHLSVIARQDGEALPREAAQAALLELNALPALTRPGVATLPEAETNQLAASIPQAREEAAREAAPMETLQTVSSLERILLVREVPLFAELSPEDLKQIAEVAREQWYPDGAVICREGDEGNEMYIIASGQVRVTKQTNEMEKLLARRGVGEFIGEMAVIESTTRSATIRAEGEVRTLVIDAQAFKSILRDRPEVSLAVLRGLSRRLRERD